MNNEPGCLGLLLRGICEIKLYERERGLRVFVCVCRRYTNARLTDIYSPRHTGLELNFFVFLSGASGRENLCNDFIICLKVLTYGRNNPS